MRQRKGCKPNGFKDQLQKKSGAKPGFAVDNREKFDVPKNRRILAYKVYIFFFIFFLKCWIHHFESFLGFQVFQRCVFLPRNKGGKKTSPIVKNIKKHSSTGSSDILVESFRIKKGGKTRWFYRPFEKYARQIGSFPQFSGWKFPKIFELPPPRIHTNHPTPGPPKTTPCMESLVAHVVWKTHVEAQPTKAEGHRRRFRSFDHPMAQQNVAWPYLDVPGKLGSMVNGSMGYFTYTR